MKEIYKEYNLINLLYIMIV